jgi:SAM-dependent methyltransferase
MWPDLLSFFRRKVLRIGRDRWNHQYRRGQWDGLAAPDELPRFSIVAGYVTFFKPDRPAILEIGCGTGLLCRRLPPGSYATYLGLDISDAAVAEARQLAPSTARFRVADMDRHTPAEPADLLILSEVLYYSRHPVQTLRQLVRCLNPGGLIIVTMNQHDRARQLWAELDTAFTTLDQTTVTNAKDTWTCRVIVNDECGPAVR